MNKSEKPVNKIAPVKQDKSLVAVDPGMLIAKAIEKGLPVETMEKLLAMRRELRAEAARDDFFIALARFQKLCPVIIKTQCVYDTSGKLRYKYAPLDSIAAQVKDYLEACGFSYQIKTKQTETLFTAICESHHISGHSESTDFTVPIDPKAYMNAAQKVATAQTYAKRYAFNNAFGIMTGEEDIDGNGLGDSKGKAEAAKKAAAEKSRKTTKTDPPPPKKTEQKAIDPETTARQKIINEIGVILKNDKFTDDDRAKIRVEISLIKSNVALEALRATWQGKLNRLEENFKDDIPEEAAKNGDRENLTDEQMADLEKTADQGWFTDEEKVAREAAEKKELQEPDIY